VAPAGVDQAAGDQWWPIAVIEDGTDQAVVLVAEVGTYGGAIAERATRGEGSGEGLGEPEQVGNEPCSSVRVG
jgi:hypothetical protein